jgi:hypothetical protein
MLQIGKSYYIRTLEDSYIGRLKEITDQFLVLEKASRVREDQQFPSTFCEIVRYKEDVYISTRHVLDITTFTHPLLHEAK